jgi:hypothetical protein
MNKNEKTNKENIFIESEFTLNVVNRDINEAKYSEFNKEKI